VNTRNESFAKSFDDNTYTRFERNPNGTHIFSASRDCDRVAAQFVVIIRLHGTGGVGGIRNGFPHAINTETCDAELDMLFQRTIYLGTFIFNTSANGGW